MSANNWTTCPKCKAAHDAAVANAMRKAQSSYGKVSQEKYAANLRHAQMLELTACEDTLREDYEIGIDGDTFEVSYRASCDRCDFRFDFRETKPIP